MAAAGLLALLAGVVAVKRFLPPEKIRALIISGAERGLGRQVKLGNVAVGLLSGLALKDFAVSEAGGFSAGTFASMSSFNVNILWTPLLRRKIVVDSISASGLSVRVVKRPDGAYNFSSFSAAASPSAGAAAAPASALSSGVTLAVRRLRLKNARLQYDEPGGKRGLVLSGLDAKVSGFSLSGPFSAELSGKAAGRWDGRPIDAAGSFSGTVDLGGQDPRRFAVSVRALEASSGGWTARASGRLKDFSQPDVDLKLSVSAPAGPVGEGRFEGRITPASGAKPLEAQGNLTLSTPGLKPAQAATLGLPPGAPVPPLKVSAQLSYRADAVAFKTLTLETPAGRLEASGAVSALSSGKPAAALDVSAALDLPALRAEEAPWLKLPKGLVLPAVKLSGKARVAGDSVTTPGLTLKGAFGTLEAAGSARGLASGRPDMDLTLAAKVDVPALKASDLPWANLPGGLVLPAAAVEGRARLKGDDLELAYLRLRANAGTVEMSGSVRRLRSAAPEPNIDLTAKLSLGAIKSADIPLPGVAAGLMLPPSRWDAALALSRDEVKVRSLRAVIGRNDFQVEGGRVVGLRGDRPLVNLMVKCRQFQLEELTAVSAQTREMKLSGSGFFVLGLTGRLPRPVLEGKLQFKGVGAMVGPLKLAGFTGTATFNERRIDVPNLRGEVGDGELQVNLTIKDYVKAPDIDLEASLSRFDMGKVLAAKAAMTAAKPGATPPAAAKTQNSEAAPVSARGKLTVADLLHPNAQARGVRVDWDLSGITPELKRLNGQVKVHSSGGRFTNLGGMATESKIVKVLLFPLMVVQKVGSIGGIKLFPDFNNVEYTELAGDYGFRDGVMSLRDSRLNSSAGNVAAAGEIDLPAERLNITVTAQVARLAPIDVEVRGTFDKPSSSVKMGKFLAEPAKQLMEGLFKK